MLRALRRLLRPGGRVALTTIYITPGLDPISRRRARRSGPRAVASRREQAQLLASAGFVDIDEVDLTAEFLVTARRWLKERDAHHDELAALQPPGEFEQRHREGRKGLRAVEDGLLRRGLFSATRPSAHSAS